MGEESKCLGECTYGRYVADQAVCGFIMIAFQLIRSSALA